MSKPNRHEMWQLQQMQALPLDIKIFKSQLRIREWVDFYGSDGVYVSFSGGKDSTVLLDLVRDLYPDVVAVFADTGLEFPEIRDFVKSISNVDWVKPKLTFKEVIDKCGYPVISKEQAEWLYRGSRSENKNVCMKHFFGVMPDGSPTKYKLSKKWRYLVNAPFKIGSGCCKELKKNPIAKYAKETNRVPIVGTMAGESMLRTQKWLQQGCNAFDNKLPQSAPLSFWSEEDIWEYIRLKQLPYCKIYDTGYSRTGCIFCMFGAHLEKEPNRFQRLKITHPKLWAYCLKPKSQGGLGMRKILDFINVPYVEGEKRMEKRIYTAESVTSGHPDKLADLIADSILDECLEQDENSHVACEVMLAHNKAFISGEITTKADIDIEYLVRSLIAQVGYDPTNIEVETRIHSQSEDIAAAVGQNENKEKRSQGAGDQGIVYGYATEETLNFMPLPLELAHRLTNRLEECRKNRIIDGLLPDGKSQVSIEYINDRFSKITSIIVSAQHRADKDFGQLTAEIKENVVGKVFEEYDLAAAEILVNPSGRFVLGGFEADTGLTGRKLMVDSYGGISHHGGGAFCVDGETEYLSENGWRKINVYTGEKIAQWDNGQLNFVNPSHYHVNKAEKMVRISSQNNSDMVLSENHDMVFITSKGNIIKKRVKDVINERDGMLNGFTGRVPSSFSYENTEPGIDLTDDEIRLQVAYCADGTILKGGNGRIRIKKDYKKARLEKLLTKTNTKYTVSQDNEYSIYYFIPPINNRSLCESLRGANSKQLLIVAHECVWWDGNRQNCLRTTKKEDADFVQFAFMVAYGTNSSILVVDRIGEEYGNGEYVRKSILYIVYIKKQKDFGLRSKKDEQVCVSEFSSSDGLMYCFTVPSGMLLLRRNNKIFVTGNCGKDASKVDRSGAYMARYIAKNIVAAGLAEKCEVTLSYAIGKPTPTAVDINTFYTGAVSENLIVKAVHKVFDLSVAGTIEKLDLKQPVYAQTAVGGHFGKDYFTWEQTDKAEELKDAILQG